MKLAIPMPWTTRMYCINMDDYGVHRPVFMVVVERKPRVISIRIGWTARCVGPHECRDGLNLGSMRDVR